MSRLVADSWGICFRLTDSGSQGEIATERSGRKRDEREEEQERKGGARSDRPAERG